MSTTLDKLIRSANQIAAELENQQPGNAVAATRDHLKLFWDPRMLSQIVVHQSDGGAGLSDTARAAVLGLSRERDNNGFGNQGA